LRFFAHVFALGDAIAGAERKKVGTEYLDEREIPVRL
jgi:hypothetical protein